MEDALTKRWVKESLETKEVKKADEFDCVKNVIYTVTTVGNGSNAFVLTRALDFNTSAEVGAGSFMFVESGTANAGKSFIQSTSGPTLDTTALVFSVFGDSNLSANSVDNTKLSNMAQATIKGRASGTSTGDPVDLTAAQLIAIINTESSATINSARVVAAAGNDLVTSLNTATSAIDCGTY